MTIQNKDSTKENRQEFPQQQEQKHKQPQKKIRTTISNFKVPFPNL